MNMHMLMVSNVLSSIVQPLSISSYACKLSSVLCTTGYGKEQE